jgi:hypothetical protein
MQYRYRYRILFAVVYIADISISTDFRNYNCLPTVVKLQHDYFSRVIWSWLDKLQVTSLNVLWRV